MIYTVFVTGNSEEEQWRSELLEFYWAQSGQAGELVRLMAAPQDAELPLHALARVTSTLPWAEHPYIDDNYPGYDLPAALLQWLWQERLDATILLLDAQSILFKGIEREVSPGEAVAQSWDNFPSGDGPFKLSAAYTDLQAYCVNRELSLPSVQLPLLIHSTDLLQLAPRWLELTGVLRRVVDHDSGPPNNLLKVALAIAMAENQLMVTPEDFSAQVVEADNGGRDFLDYCDRFESAQVSGESLGALRPYRCPGVREARVLDQIYLELGPRQLKSLNLSAASIWNLCDGQNTLLEIARELQSRYEITLEAIAPDVLQGAKLLCLEGAINLEGVS